MRYRLVLALIIIASLAASADACHGLLRRLFGPRDYCPPPTCVVVEPKAVAKEREVDTLEGRVIWVDDLPKVKDLREIIGRDFDKKFILNAPKDQLLDPTWRIDPNTRGVANVAVFIKRPKDGSLPIRSEDKIRRETIVIDTPFGIFVPHVVAHYPHWVDGKERGDTGQKLIIKNSSPIVVNARSDVHSKYNPGFNRTIPSAKEYAPELKPQPLPVILRDDLHTWSSAYVWVFDHPYFAITKTDGTFSIPRVPAGMEVQVMAWHESQGWLLTKEGRTMQLKKGKNTLNITMGADNASVK